MATTSYNVTTVLYSAIGYKRPSYAFEAPSPRLFTTHFLDGTTGSVTELTGTKILSVNTLTDFDFYANTTSTAQTITLTNIGSDPITLSNTTPIRMTSLGVDFKRTAISTGTIIYPAGSTSFSVTYSGSEPGIYNNRITIVSDAENSPYLINSRQIVRGELDFNVDPTGFSTVSNLVGEVSTASYQILPVVNQEYRPDLAVPFTYTLVGDYGWEVVSTGTNNITIEFSNHDVNNVNGTYTSQLTLVWEGSTAILNNVCVVDIDPDKFRNLSAWISPISPNNSVIGVSYDLINGEKTLTIGVGMGGDGTPVYDDGGDIFLDIRNLGIGADSIDYPYAHWAEVYRFSNLGTGTAKTYISAAKDDDGNYVYQKKFSNDYNYSYYFGYERSFGSMFIVEDDGFGSLKISLNNLRETSGDEGFDNTLHNLTNAFHYYSLEDVPSRTINLPQYPFSTSTTYPVSTATLPLPPGEARTRMFLGFDALSTSTFTVATSLVSIPNF